MKRILPNLIDNTVKKKDIGEPPLCKCGCGEPVMQNKDKRRWNIWRPGHQFYRQTWLARWNREEEAKKRKQNASL